MARRYSSEYKNLQPYVVEDIRKVVNAAGASGGGSVTQGVTDHGALTGLGDDDHPQYLTPVRGDARYITSARQVIAGNGLTGGGDLSADRTFNVGVSGLGLGVGADAVTLTSSSDVGTSPAAAILASTAGGALTLSSLFVKGSVSLTNNGDLTVAGSGSYAGSDVLFVDSSGGNVGILRVPDSQFALDIAGPARAEYWIGPHAIQLSNVVLLSHFDGRLPYETNYSGEPNGHMGQVATVAGGVIFRPGKYYKAVQIAESGYNYCPNPSAETNATGWTQEYNGGTLTSQARTQEQALYGTWSVKMTASAASTYTFNQPHFHAPASVTMTWNNTETATISCYVRGVGTWRLVFEDAGQNLRAFKDVTLSGSNPWQRVVLTATNASGNNYASIRLSVFPWSTNCTLYVDAVHYEKTVLASPYIDGSLSIAPGHGWDSTAHASYSYRNVASLYYAQASPPQWTIMFWAYRAAWQTGRLGYLLGWGGANTSFYYSSTNHDTIAGFDAGVPSDGWHHYCIVYDGSTVLAYRDGAYVNKHTSAVTPAAALYVGWSGSAEQCNSLIDDLCLLERAMVVNADFSCDELRSVYESNAPVFAETSTFSFRPTPKGLIWADDEGLWMKATDGDTVLGVYGNDSQTKSWGGQTMSAGDLLIGNASNYVFWDDSAATLTISGTVTAGAGAIGGWTIGATALTAGSGATRVGVDSGGTNPAFYAGSATPASAPFRVTNAGALTATSATITGSILASSGGISGNFYVGSDVGAAGSLFVGSNADIRMSGDGIRLVMADLGSSPTIPTNSSALRWFPSISATHDNTKDYSGIIGYRHTGQSIVDNVWTSYVGSAHYTTYSARVILQSGNYDGATYRDTRLEVVKDPGANAVGTVLCVATYTNIDGMLGLYAKTAGTLLNGMCHVYQSPGHNFVIAYFNGTTTKFRYFDLTTTSAPSWQYSTSAPA